MFRVAKGNGARQRVIGNCAGLLGPLPLDSFILYEIEWETAFAYTCLALFIYCPTKILAWTIDNKRNTIAAGKEKDRLPQYLGSYLAIFTL